MTSFRQFWDAFLRVPNPATGELVSPKPHVAQAEVIEALDAIDPETGLRRWPIVFLHWCRKASKDFSIGAYVLYHLACDPWEREPRFAAVAAWDAEQTAITKRSTQQLIARHEWLSKNFRVLKDEIVCAEQVRDPRTGGTYAVEHLAQFLSRDTKGSHGLQISLKVHNELWTDADYSFEEALMPSPARRSPVTLYASYHGLRTQMVKGVPIFDLIQRAQRGDPRLFYSFVGGDGARAPQRIVPWITDAWIDEQRALLAHAPGRFRRMILNIPAGPDAGLIAYDELQDSIDKALPVRERGEPGVRYVVIADLGIANDWTAVVVLHVDADARVVVDLVRTWRPENGQKVQLEDVEIEIRRLARLFPCDRIIFDQWQAEFMQQRLVRSGLPAVLVTFEASRQDRVITLLKSVFSKRQIRIPAHEIHLIEQLESVQAVESRRRDLLKFAPSGTGIEAGQHDDIVVALALGLEHVQAGIGKVALADMSNGCALEYQEPLVDCMLWGGMYPATARVCRTCPGLVSAAAIHQRYLERGGDLDIRTWLHTGGVQPNRFVINKRLRLAMERRGLV